MCMRSIGIPAAALAAAVLLTSVIPACTNEQGGARVERVFYNGTIYTMDESRPVAEAVSMGGGRIIAVGGSQEVLAAAGPDAKRIDLEGLTVIPGLIDAHAHFLSYAQERARLDLVGTASLEEVVARVADWTGRTEGGQWIVGRGWDQNDWPVKQYPHRRELDRVTPVHPVYLKRICGHAAYANSAALELAGIDADTPNPPGGRIERDPNGDPTGILIDEAMSLVSDIIPAMAREERKRLLVEAANACLAVGLVGVHEMGVTGEMVSIYRELLDAESLPVRITAYFSSEADGLDSLLETGCLRGYADHHLSVIGVKFFADGSLGARSAAMLEDYTDDPGNRGVLVTDADSLYEQVVKVHRRGFSAAVHAIGDRGNRMALDVFERVLRQKAPAPVRHRIEHAQIIAPADIHRFVELGVIPSMQFTHCTSDMPWAGDRVGPARLAGAYAWRSLMDTGCRIPGGSDFPVESINPFLGIYAAVTRRDLAGNPPDGWMSEQCLTIEEAVRAFTVNAAFASGEDAVRGSITPGKLADFIVISEDIMTVPPDVIPRIEVLTTVVGGTVVYHAE